MIKSVDGKNELSESEEEQLAKYKREYDDIKSLAIANKCDYYNIPKWDI